MDYEDDDDDDVSDFLVPPPHHRIPVSRGVVQARGGPAATAVSDDDDDDDDDDEFLHPPPQLPPAAISIRRAPHSPPMAPQFPTPLPVVGSIGGGGGASSSIVSALEREVTYWRTVAEQTSTEKLEASQLNTAWRMELKGLLTRALTACPRDVSVQIEETLRHAAAANASLVHASSPHQFLLEVASQSIAATRPPIVETPPVVSSGNREIVRLPVVVEDSIPSTQRALSFMSPQRNLVEDIEKSDDDNQDGYGGGKRSAARHLRRQRSQYHATHSPVAASMVVLPPPSHSTATVAPPGAMEVSQKLTLILLERSKAHSDALQGLWFRQADAVAAERTTRRAHKLWRAWAEERHTLRLARGRDAAAIVLQGGDARRQCQLLSKLKSDQLWSRHVLEGTLRSMWNRWTLFLLCCRQRRVVEEQLEQYAQQGAVMGALIKNHNDMWSGFVDDAATILSHQFHGLASLRRAGDGVVYRSRHQKAEVEGVDCEEVPLIEGSIYER
ncbi:Hypothetical protein, putative [Bodo saltans]|uniref:Uncharacterized protein n=1 Tax=Bodo saltans TaxID=75058 RepID=A0A0S4KK14_BODSA|nr:Hypothetical protein, putative [Bodo saltans]|eukprot:CUI12390.1 Hypothetical protein, putative [Bodo saltans]